MPIDLTQFLKLDNNGDFKLGDSRDNFNEVAKDLQGNILKSHGRDYAVHIFIKFNDKQKAREFISKEVALKITSARKQEDDSRAFKSKNSNGTRMFINFSISSKGYKLLGESDKQPNESNAQGRLPFTNGMKEASTRLNDPINNGWKNDWHALLILANTQAKKLETALNKWLLLIENNNGIHLVERGEGIRNNDGHHIEHFGYVDGISQPLLVSKDSDTIPKKWDPRARLSTALVPDPGGKTENAFGSFLVFRKLEQNVKGFKEAEVALAKNLEIPIAFAGAQIVGRFRNGQPLVTVAPAGHQSPAKMNDFNFDSDSSTGTKCPFHAHIRKTNPRGSGGVENKEAEKAHLFIRRGITYGEDSRKIGSNPETGVGLLFMAYNSSIINQFEFMQANWANNTDFPNQPSGIDGIIGQGTFDTPQSYLKGWGENAKKESVAPAIGGFVKMLGGEYFFTPSISFLKSLSKSNIT